MIAAADGAGGVLIALGLGVVATMLLTPLAQQRAVRAVAAGSLIAAMIAALARLGVPQLPPSQLLTDDGMARFASFLVCLTGLGCLAFLRPGAASKEAPSLMVLATFGAAVLCGAVHAATIFLGLEVVTLSLIAMFVLPLTRAALEAGYKLLILGGIGAAALLFGFALLYAATGKLGLDAWSQRGFLINLGVALLLAGLAFKFSLVPFQMWTPDAFSGAPAAAAAFAGVGSKIGVAVVLMRTDASSPPDPLWSAGLLVAGGASVLLGNLQALRQDSIARMLGYSSIAHSGYLALIIASGAISGPQAVMFYLAAYAPALISALCIAGCLGGTATIEGVRGLIWRHPFLGLTFLTALLALAGLPPTVGFFAKFYLFAALIQVQAWWPLSIAAVGSAVGIYVYFRYVTAAFRQSAVLEAPVLCWPDVVVLAVCLALMLAFGLYPEPLIDVVQLVTR